MNLSYINIENKQKKRSTIIDLLRGISMLGIMTVNFPSMNTFSGKETTSYLGIYSLLDKCFAYLNFLIFNEKFYPIFACLFGFTSYIIFSSVNNKYNGSFSLIRRFLFLSFIGLLHISLVWYGDILLVYSVLGFCLIPFLKLKSRIMLQISFYILIGLPILHVIINLLQYFKMINIDITLFSGYSYYDQDYLVNIYANGNFSSIVQQRINDYVKCFSFLYEENITVRTIFVSLSYFAQLFGCMLLGAFVYKESLHEKIHHNLQKLGVFWLYSLLLLIPLTATRVLYTNYTFRYPIETLQSECMSVFYVFSLIFIFLKFRNSIVLDYIQSVGKMSLSSYLFHTTVCSFILYGYGAGQFGKIGPAKLFVCSLITYSIAAILCKLYLLYFNYGPVEYILRLFTYRFNFGVKDSTVEKRLPRS